MKTIRKVFLALLLIAVLGLCYGAWILLGSKTINSNNYKLRGDRRHTNTLGYERIIGDDAAYSEFLCSLPLKGKGSDVMLYTGGKSRFQSLDLLHPQSLSSSSSLILPKIIPPIIPGRMPET